MFSSGERHLAFYAARDIGAGEELLFDYAYPIEFEEQFLKGPQSAAAKPKSHKKKKPAEKSEKEKKEK